MRTPKHPQQGNRLGHQSTEIFLFFEHSDAEQLIDE
jgi:hypothetical protein